MADSAQEENLRRAIEQIAQERRIKTRGKFINQRGIAGHRFRHDDMGPFNTRSVKCGNAKLFPRALRPQP